jgi:LPXTG-site transpeptidase (sortase) family protein
MSIGMSNAGTLNPPANPREVGWWDASAKPGSKVGQTIITGHTVHTGGGQLDHLGTIKQGAIILIHQTDGSTLTYRETRVETLGKAEVAERSVELFGQDDASNRLVLITCSGWTGSGYLSNVFVYATPVGA